MTRAPEPIQWEQVKLWPGSTEYPEAEEWVRRSEAEAKVGAARAAGQLAVIDATGYDAERDRRDDEQWKQAERDAYREQER